MKIYTKTGDKGETSLLGGKRVPKYHQRIEAYGTVDELIAFIGLLRDHQESNPYSSVLLEIQDKLMTAAAILAADCENCGVDIPEITDADIRALEEAIDSMNAVMPPLTTFILPGGNKAASLCHVSRTICRRAERNALRIPDEDQKLPLVITYLNRLSDYLFVLARKISYDSDVEPVSWNPNQK